MSLARLPTSNLYVPPSSEAGPSKSPIQPSRRPFEDMVFGQSRPKGLKSFKPWSFSGRKRPEVIVKQDDQVDLTGPYERLRVCDPPPLPLRPDSIKSDATPPGAERSWQGSDEDGTDNEADAYSWVDPSIVGTERLRATPTRTPSRSLPASPGQSVNSLIAASQHTVRIPPSPSSRPPPRPGTLAPADSYNLLLAYQSSTSSHGNTPSPPMSPPMSPFNSSEGLHTRNPDPEWHDLVDPSMLESLGRPEVRRQGLWWELIKGEIEYVRDLRVICNDFIHPLKHQEPPLLQPEAKLNAFIAEVFSTIPQMWVLHEQLLDRLLERQRLEWPLMTSATDLLLRTFLEVVDLYEVYMKNYPFAEARVRRESVRSPSFRAFINQRNTSELTRKRDLSVFLSRPVTRLPRIILLLDALLQTTPPDHPDTEEIPTVISILTAALKGSQPGIESAEAKIKLWNVAEKLLFKKGEIIELDVGEPKRSLVHSGYVFRRVRSETNWHGWQDLHAFLLDNYFLLTRDEEHGKHVVVSRPIHLDFLTLVSADGVPERRHDYISQARRRHSAQAQDHMFQPERLMFPFTIATDGGANSRTYTLCVSSQAARDQWREKIEGAKTLRQFDVDSNRNFAIHHLFIPPQVKDPLMTADTFTWLGRETVAVATPRSIWIGWRRDSKSYRELIRFTGGFISTVTIVPEFGKLLVITSGSLVAFNLYDMIPTHEPSTWIQITRGQGTELSAPDHTVAFVRVGSTKGRTLVVHASYVKNSHQTLLTFEEPLHTSTPDEQSFFRRFAQLVVPGYASELSFFRQTIAVVTEKSFVIAEPGNPTFNSIPTFPATVSNVSTVGRMVTQAKPMSMYQIAENEFVLAYDWGACFVTKYGEISRNGSFMRWNVTPSYIIFRPPHLLLFEESSGRIEIRDVNNGKMCEVLEEKGMKALRLSRIEQGMLAISSRGLLEVVETVEL